MRRYVTDDAGGRIEHTGIKVWYVICGTHGKRVEWSWLIGPGAGCEHDVYLVDSKGRRGTNSKDSTFFTKQTAIDNWRYHSKAEDDDHLDTVVDIANGMIEAAEAKRKTLRPTKPWQDL